MGAIRRGVKSRRNRVSSFAPICFGINMAQRNWTPSPHIFFLAKFIWRYYKLRRNKENKETNIKSKGVTNIRSDWNSEPPSMKKKK